MHTHTHQTAMKSEMTRYCRSNCQVILRTNIYGGTGESNDIDMDGQGSLYRGGKLKLNPKG